MNNAQFIIGSFLVFVAYLIGAIPTGYLFARFFHGIDIRTKGSGNIGATNVARVLGVYYFIVIFLTDAGKACLFLIGLQSLSVVQPVLLLACASALLVGNAYSCFLRFDGGKGVATSVGVLCAIAPYSVLGIFAATWVLVLLCSRWAAFASVTAMLSASIYYWIFYGSLVDPCSYFLGFLIVWFFIRHQRNFALPIQ